DHTQTAAAAKTSTIVDDRVRIVRLAHAAGAANMESARHIVSNVVRECGVVVGGPRPFRPGAGKPAKRNVGQRRNGRRGPGQPPPLLPFSGGGFIGAPE